MNQKHQNTTAFDLSGLLVRNMYLVDFERMPTFLAVDVLISCKIYKHRSVGKV